LGKKLTVKEYKDKYDIIPKEFHNRFIYLWKLLKFKESDLKKIKSSIKHILNMDKKEISFVFYFIPEATPRPRYSRFTKSFYVKNSVDYKSIFEEFVNSCKDIELITTPCEFYCKTYKPIPSAMNKVETLLSELELIKDISKADWDNLAKTYCDMIQHGLLLDDSIIYKGQLEKLYSIKPRIEITIKYYDTHDSTYNKRKIDKIINK
jgi:Holliday junction resolvase RusA-like endonuclease